MLPARAPSLVLTGLCLLAIVAAPVAASPLGSPATLLLVRDAVAYEDAGVLSFPVELSRPAPTALRLQAIPRSIPRSIPGPGGAQPGRDFHPGPLTVILPPGATRASLEVPIQARAGVGPDLDLTLLLRLASAPGVILVRQTARGVIRDADPLTLNLLHLNDHHSNLQPVVNTLDLGTSGGAFNLPFGGFPQVTAQIRALESQLGNLVRIHAGDAITGTLYFTLFRGEADARLMNTVCFDLFALGNHEFDEGDAALARFLDWLNADPQCRTTTLAANVIPQIGTPLAPRTATDYLQSYAIRTFEGQPVAFIGIDVAGKTRDSSRPLPTTQFRDELATAQAMVDEVRAKGIDNIVLVTHHGYENDLRLAQAMTGVDAIVGGDSHTLLGDFQAYGLPAAGPYPTLVANAEGDPVCIVQAWQSAWILGHLGITFRKGRTAHCAGTPYLLLGDSFSRQRTEIGEPERADILAAIDADPRLSPIAPDPLAQAILDDYAAQVDALSQRVIGIAGETLCSARLPGGRLDDGACAAGTVAREGARLDINGGFAQQVVADAFLARSFRADLALHNTGGVRFSLPAGEIDIGLAYRLLPFSNTLVELDLSGQEILDSLEEALDFLASDPASRGGAFPSGSGVRWEIDMTQPRGSRVSAVELRARASGDWSAIDPAARYVLVTHSYLAGGRDGYATFGRALAEGRFTDTFIQYAQAFVDYLEQDLAGAVLLAPPPSRFSTQAFIALP